MSNEETQRKHERHVNGLLNEIEDLRSELVVLENTLAIARNPTFEKHSRDHWARWIFHLAVKRLLMFLDQNFRYIETLSLLALTRYIFELAVWVRLIAGNRAYAMVYYREHIATMRAYNKLQLEHLKREAALFKKIGSHEAQKQAEAMAIAMAATNEDERLDRLKDLPANLMGEVDREAARNFAVHLDDAFVNGYGFQAYLIETKAIPAAVETDATLDAEEKAFDQAVDEPTRKLWTRRWNWKHAADVANMTHEYEFIYGYTSKLLHATPASLVTDHPNLELVEMRTFLRYIWVTVRSLCELIKSPSVEDLLVPHE